MNRVKQLGLNNTLISHKYNGNKFFFVNLINAIAVTIM